MEIKIDVIRQEEIQKLREESEKPIEKNEKPIGKSKKENSTCVIS